MLDAFEVSVKILVRTNHQQLQGVLIEYAVSKETQEVTHAELVYLHAGQITDFDISDIRLANDGSNCLIKREFLLLVQLFNDALEGPCDKDSHQSN
jgi:hypothetical protein